MPDELPKQIGPYQIVEQLGKGGMAVVYKAVQTTLNRIVAVKVLPRDRAEPGWVERFHREAQAVAMLNHPNIVQIIDKDEEDGRLYFAMEYVAGASLDKILNQRRLSLSEALKIFKEVCRGLEYAHQHKVIHRDLNPRNILVSDDLSKVKLADFGICRVESITRQMGTLSTREVSFGTLHYLAPEQASNMVKTDHRSDIFSLGVLFYEMLTGKVPVGRFSLPSRLNAEVPPELDPIVLKCLATEPSERYQSVSEVLSQIQSLEENLRFRLVDELKGFSRSTSKIFKRSTQSFGSKRSLTMLLGGVTLASLTVILVLIFRPGNVPDEGLPSAQNLPPLIDLNQAAEPASIPLPAFNPEGTERVPQGPANPVDMGVAQPDPAVIPANLAGQTNSGNPQQAAPPPPSPAASATPSPAAPPPAPTPPAAGVSSSTKKARENLSQSRQKFETGLYEPALADVDALLQSQPGTPLSLDALFLKAAILKKLGRGMDEKAVYSKIIEDYPDQPRQAEAQFRRGEMLRSERAEGWPQPALELFAAVGKKDSEFSAPALLRQGEIEGMLKLMSRDEALGQVPAGLVTYRRLVQTYPQAVESEYAYWSLANMYRELEQFELSAEMLTKLGMRFPGTTWDAWFAAGELFEEKLKDNRRAREAYEKVPETSRNYQRAQRKLSRLKP